MATVLAENKRVLQQAKSPLNHRRSWWLYLCEISLYLVLFVALLEAYFSIAGIGQQEFLQPDPEFGVKHIPNKLVTWRMEGYSSEKINSDGLRDVEHSFQKLAGVYRIALLGDSATEGLQVCLNDTYGQALERMLNTQFRSAGVPPVPRARFMRPLDLSGTHGVPLPTCASDRQAPEIQHFEVINFGCSSYSTGQQLEQYRQQVLKYEPDAVVLLYNRGDSLENVIKSDAKLSSIEPRPYFYLNDKGALCIDKSILAANQNKLRPNPILDFLRANSRIYGVFSQANLSLSMNDSRYRKFTSWLQSLPLGKTGRGTPCVSDGRAERLRSQGIEDPLKVTLALVHTLAAEAKSHHQIFIFMMFPNTIGDPEVDRQQKQLNKLADQDGFDFIDLLPPFQNADPDADFIQIHFSPIGHKRVALMLFNLIHSKLSSYAGTHGVPLPPN